MAARARSSRGRTDLHRFTEATALPLLIHRGAVGAEAAEAYERLFARYGWSNPWRDGIFDYHHFHATTHEVLGIVRGRVEVRFGGRDGTVITLKSGDVAVIPAGISHRNERATKDLVVVGAYPGGRDYDVVRGTPEGRRALMRRLERVAVPEHDPSSAREGLTKEWHVAS
jgi:uncharacterized protein YjlB